MSNCSHVWTEEYYGYLCVPCGLFYPYGCAPWEDDDDTEWIDEGDIELIDDPDAIKRVHDLFMQKLTAEHPDHPWVKRQS